jgi:hypothetical protein
LKPFIETALAGAIVNEIRLLAEMVSNLPRVESFS